MLSKHCIIVTNSLNLSCRILKREIIMKKLILILAVIFSASTAFAQDCKKSCEGKKDKFVLENGLINATLYHDNGVIAQKGFYTKENKLQGEWTSYDTEGNKTAVAQYDNGEKVGTWKFYQGSTLKEVTYANSKIAKVNTWEAKDTRVVFNK